jgi:flagellar basal body-associated protein FliL
VAGRIKTWVWVVLGVIVTCVVAVVAIVGAGFYFFRQHIETRTVTPASASREFEEVKTRFVGQKPLVELDRHGNFVRSNPDRAAPRNGRIPEELFVMAFDPDDDRVVRIQIPFWLLRLKSGGSSINFNGSRMDLEDLKLSVADLERFGPTLIVDHSSANGKRVLVWSQ